MKLCITFGQFFFDNFGLMCSFGLGLFVDLGMVSLNGLGTSPVPRKIHMRKIERAQGHSKHDNIEEFLDLRPSPASKMSSGEQNRVLTHSIERFTWLEELVSESNTIQTQEDISVSGKIAGNIKPKLCMIL